MRFESELQTVVVLENFDQGYRPGIASRNRDCTQYERVLILPYQTTRRDKRQREQMWKGVSGHTTPTNLSMQNQSARTLHHSFTCRLSSGGAKVLGTKWGKRNIVVIYHVVGYYHAGCTLPLQNGWMRSLNLPAAGACIRKKQRGNGMFKRWNMLAEARTKWRRSRG